MFIHPETAIINAANGIFQVIFKLMFIDHISGTLLITTDHNFAVNFHKKVEIILYGILSVVHCLLDCIIIALYLHIRD